MCQLLPDFLIQSWPTCCPLSQISSASHEKQLPVTELLVTEQAIRWLLRKCSSLLPDSELEQIPRSFPWPNHKVTGSSVVGFFAWPLLLWPLIASRICCRELYILAGRFISNNGTLQVLKNLPLEIFQLDLRLSNLSCYFILSEDVSGSLRTRRGVLNQPWRFHTYSGCNGWEPCVQVTFTQLNSPSDVLSGSGLLHSWCFNPQWQCRIWSSSALPPRGFDRWIRAHM